MQRATSGVRWIAGSRWPRLASEGASLHTSFAPARRGDLDARSRADEDPWTETVIIESRLPWALLPDVETVLVVVPFACVVSLLAGLLATRLRRRGVPAPYTRKVFHFAIFSFAAVMHLWRGPAGVVTFGGVVAALVLYATIRRNRLFYALARPSDAPRERLFVLAPLLSTAAGGLLANAVFGPFAIVGYLVAGWGDALAEPVGTRWGRHRYRVHSMFGVAATRSLEGSAAVLVAGAMAGFIGLVVLGVPHLAAIVVAGGVGLTGAVVEALSTHGVDNLTVQVAASGVAAYIVQSMLGVPVS